MMSAKKLFAILVLVGSLGLSIGFLLVPIDSPALASLGYVGVFLATFISALSLFVPGPSLLTTFMAGAVLNPWLVSIVAGLGSAAGETSGYLVGASSRVMLSERVTESAWYQRITRLMTTRPFLTILTIAAIPNPLVDLAGMAAGHLRYPYHRFFLATFLGKTVRFALAAFLGAQLM
jgi:membrane protein DedA with SNARE-associated domain